MRQSLFALGIIAPLAVTACSDGSGPSNAGQVTLSLSTRAGALASVAGDGPALAANETYNDGTNTLVFTRVQMVFREIELETADGQCSDDSDHRSNRSNDDDESCPEIEFGPYLADLPLGENGAQRALSVPVPPGTYSEFEFDVHKPSRSDDAAFIAANPDFDEVSIRAEGTYNGQPFTFTTDLEEEIEQDLVPPLVVDSTATANLTINLDIGSWFRGTNGQLFNPASANKGGPNESRAKTNIQNSIEAFEDDDRDGEDD